MMMVKPHASHNVVRNALDIMAAVLLVAAGIVALYYWDPSRALFKRLAADDDRLYETVDPRFRDQDPAALIRVRDAASLRETRAKVIEAIWGQPHLPENLYPDEVVRDLDKRMDIPGDCPSGPDAVLVKRLRCEASGYADWANLAGIDELRIIVRSPGIASEYVASIAYFRPSRPNGILVVYQNGFASTYHAQHRHLERLVARGFTVAASNLAAYGDSRCPTAAARRWCDVSNGRYEVPQPLRVHFDPLIAAINFARREGVVRDVAIIGFSGGAWVASVLAAADTRIRTSYPVAGVMPPYLRRTKETSAHQDYPPLMATAGTLDLFVLGAGGPGRRQVQYFNRYDRCCFNGTRPLLYEGAVRQEAQAAGGSFAVVIDETHARHKISRWAFERIVADLARPGGAP